MSNVVELDDKRDVHWYVEKLKSKMNVKHITIVTVNKDNTIGTYVEHALSDMELVYSIQTLKDRREMRLRDVNQD